MSAMEDAAAQLVDLLDAGQRARACFGLDDASETERRTWYYFPTERAGLPLAVMDRAQHAAFFRLLATGLGERAFVQASLVTALEEVLDRSERWSTDRRNARDYWVSIFGSPGDGPWAWRIEGHHVCVNIAVVDDGAVSTTPLFLGANPAEAAGVRLFAPEEDLGFELLAALSTEQRAAAIVADDAPSDILTTNQPRIDGVPTGGVPLTALAGPATKVAEQLVQLYLDRFETGPGRLRATGARFAWAGAESPGIGHYYRIAGPDLLVELDNTQNDANHVHTVVRHPDADFGGSGPLAEHHRRQHSAGAH